MENTLRIVVSDLSESIETENVKIDKETLLNREALLELLKSDYERDVCNEYLSEILNSGKRFNFPYKLDKEKYQEFIKNHKLRSMFGRSDESMKSELLDIVGDTYARFSIDFTYNDSSYDYDGVEGIILRPELSNYFENMGWRMDRFCLPLNTKEDAAAVVEFINEVVGMLGEPDLEYKKERLADYNKDLKAANDKINALNSIQ